MSTISAETSLNSWLQAVPLLCGSPESDVPSFAAYVQGGYALLGTLGPKTTRSPEQTSHAVSIHNACREVRRQFMELNAGWLYDLLTNDRTIHLSLAQLVYKAAELCPGLVPTKLQMDEESSRQQAEKEGYEIDQGLFFHVLLRSQKIGAHLIESALQPTARSRELLAGFRSSGRVDLGSVLVERQGDAAHLTVNNAHCLNAEDDRLIDDMETAVDLALMDDQVRVGVLRGGIMTHPRYAGRRVFSAGINLKELHVGRISYVNFLLRRELGYIHKIIRGLMLENQAQGLNSWRNPKRVMGKPWIAAVDSFAIGGGAQLLLVFDRIIGANDSYFSLPAAQEGIVPGFANLRLHRSLGSRKARQVILSGRQIWASEADASLLFDEVVDSCEMDAAIERNIQQLGNPAVVANRHMLNLAEEPLEIFLRYASEFALLQAERLYSEDVLGKIRKFSKVSPHPIA